MEVVLIKTLILVCLSTIDPSACNHHTALMRLRGPTTMIQQCAMSGETIAATSPDAILGNRYLKIVCERLEAAR